MIKKLRLRFIITASLSILFVLFLTIGGINVFNYTSATSQMDSSLHAIIENGFRDAMNADPSDEPRPDEDKPPREGGRYEPDIMREHYFIVEFDSEGNATSSNFLHIFSISQTDGLTLAKSIYEGSSDHGQSGNYRYLKSNQESSCYVACLDVKERMDELGQFLTSSSLISAVAYLILVALIVLSSKIVFRPSEVAYRKQKGFITNASHELKTPLTVISADLELVEMDHGKSEWTESIRDQVEKLATMTNQLVKLSKLDELSDHPIFEIVSISELGEHASFTFSPSFLKQGLTLTPSIEQEVKAKGNAQMFGEIFYILLDNALKYAKRSSEVLLSVKRTSRGEAIIEVSNELYEGAEIDTEQIFDRFYRGASSKGKGSGIGLSIVKQIADVYKGKASAEIKGSRIFFSISFSGRI